MMFKCREQDDRMIMMFKCREQDDLVRRLEGA